MYMLSHRSTLYWFVAMFLSYRSSTVYSFMADLISHGGMDPHCIFGGHILSQCFHGSCSVLVDDHALSQFILSIGMPTSGMIHIYCLMFVCSFRPGSPTPTPLH
jgi:hypothetical protein